MLAPAPVPQFSLAATTLSTIEGAVPDHQQRHLQGQVAGRLLLAEGLHLRLPDRESPAFAS